MTKTLGVLCALLGLCIAAAPAKVELTLVDGNATGYGTFQSHNQKVLSNRGGIFMAHLRTRNDAYTAQQWRLSRSIDGGKTFTTVYEATHGTHPPCIESDENDNVYLVRSEFADGHAYLHTFFAADGYAKPRVTPIPGGSAQKFALCYDGSRKLLYYASHHRFDVIALDGTVRNSMKLLQWGKNAEMQYPILCTDRAGVLHFAWTTVPFGKMTYRSIHFMHSPDAGATWRNPDGSPLTPPMVADDTGPAARVNLDDELEASNWLSSFLERDGKEHFLYQSTVSPPRQHYVRYDLKTAKRELDMRQPTLKGETVELRGLDGFFSASEKTLYVAGHTPDSRIGCLASDDNGTTWRDHALSEPLDGLYALGGCRAVTADGFVIGSFTQSPSTGGGSKVYFLRIAAHAK
ncbi:MAG: BNR repeat-containing protein [Planctomycetota bacterium]|nr:BNR repeat-containing protein [Planctomycetota bacterium]